MIRSFRRRHQERHLGYATVFTGADLRRAVDIVEAGGVVAIAIDIAPASDRVCGDFLGAPRHVPAGPAYLALKTGATIVIARLERLHFGRNRLTLEPVVAPAVGDWRDGVEKLTLLLAEAYERFIVERPEQWAWRMWHETLPAPECP